MSTLRSRSGFTLTEVIIALVMTGVIGAAITSVFITQTRFYDRQEKVSSARGVSRGAMNILTSELRMIERVNGVVDATSTKLVLRVPYAMGISCGSSSGTLAIRYVPTDQTVLNDDVYSGYAWLGEDGVYNYFESGTSLPEVAAGNNACESAGIAAIPSGGTLRITAGTVPVGVPVFLFQRIVYEFKASAEMPGRLALWRRIERKNLDEELLAPFAATARFRFYINDSATPVDDPPAALEQLTGIQIIMDGLSQRPNSDGTHEAVPLSTSVFFKNRL
jgi:prepilin-type N-terminal cleavage/methylation domain-containing protein